MPSESRLAHNGPGARLAPSIHAALPRIRHGDGQARVKERVDDLEGQDGKVQAAQELLGLALRQENCPFRPGTRRRWHGSTLAWITCIVHGEGGRGREGQG